VLRPTAATSATTAASGSVTVPFEFSVSGAFRRGWAFRGLGLFGGSGASRRGTCRTLDFDVDSLAEVIVSGGGIGDRLFATRSSPPGAAGGRLTIRRLFGPPLFLERLCGDGGFGGRIGVGTPASADRPASGRAAGFRGFGRIKGTFRSHAVYFRKTKKGDRQGTRRPRVGPSRREWRASLETARKRDTSRAKSDQGLTRLPDRAGKRQRSPTCGNACRSRECDSYASIDGVSSAERTTNTVRSLAARKLRKRGGGQQNPSISP